MWRLWLRCSCCFATSAHYVSVRAVAAAAASSGDGAGAFEFHHIQYLFHSYNVRDDDAAARLAVVHWSVVFVVWIVAGVVVAVVQRSLNVHWQFQEVSRSSVKARCSGRHVLADEGDGAQRQRSGPGVYFGRLLNNARMQL